MCIQLPEVVRIVQDQEIKAVNHKLMCLDTNLKQLMNDCLSVEKFKDVYSQPDLPINALSEFEAIAWVNFHELRRYLYQKDMRKCEHFLNWLDILLPVYKQMSKIIIKTMKVQRPDQLRDIITNCLLYNVNFIEQALKILISQTTQQSNLNQKLSSYSQQTGQLNAAAVITEQPMSAASKSSESFKSIHNNCNQQTSIEQQESTTVTVVVNLPKEVDQNDTQNLLKSPMSNENEKEKQGDQNLPATIKYVNPSITTEVTNLVDHFDSNDSQANKEENHEPKENAEQMSSMFTFRCNLL